MAIIYIPHGGGPLPLLGDPNHKGLVSFLQNVRKKINRPESIVIISAHWIEKQPTILNGTNPDLYYDYYGFPPESYKIKYPAKGNPGLGTKVHELLKSKGFKPTFDEKRGFDHGMFVPLKLMFPEADIPCIQISLINDLEPKTHIELGRAISELNLEDVLIIGSGMSFHNIRALLNPDHYTLERSIVFDEWLKDTLIDSNLTIEQKQQRLIDWLSVPYARYCHPIEDHLIPLHVCFGIVSNNYSVPHVVYNEKLMGARVSAFLWI